MTTVAPARPRRRRLLPIVVGLVVLGVVVVVAAAVAVAMRVLDDPSDAAAVVGVSELRVIDSHLEPPVVQVTAGSELTWTWTGSEEHNVVFDDESSPTQADGSWSRTFEDAGDYEYRCTLHLGMRGRVEVVDP